MSNLIDVTDIINKLLESDFRDSFFKNYPEKYVFDSESDSILLTKREMIEYENTFNEQIFELSEHILKIDGKILQLLQEVNNKDISGITEPELIKQADSDFLKVKYILGKELEMLYTMKRNKEEKIKKYEYAVQTLQNAPKYEPKFDRYYIVSNDLYTFLKAKDEFICEGFHSKIWGCNNPESIIKIQL